MCTHAPMCTQLFYLTITEILLSCAGCARRKEAIFLFFRIELFDSPYQVFSPVSIHWFIVLSHIFQTLSTIVTKPRQHTILLVTINIWIIYISKGSMQLNPNYLCSFSTHQSVKPMNTRPGLHPRTFVSNQSWLLMSSPNNVCVTLYYITMSCRVYKIPMTDTYSTNMHKFCHHIQ